MTSRPRTVALAAALLLTSACAEKKKVARPASPTQAPPTPAALAPPQQQEPAAQGWSYSSVGKRDPFRSFVLEAGHGGNEPPETRCTTPLGKFDIEQLKLVAVVTGLDDPVAMVEAPNGVGYSLHRGACIGRNGGVISSVRTGEVVIAEWIVRADGKRERTQTLLRLPKEPTLEIEE